MQSDTPTRQLLRNVYLLCAVSAITCAGLVTVLGWQHLRQHAREAEQARVHLHAIGHLTDVEGMLLRSTTQGEAHADSGELWYAAEHLIDSLETDEQAAELTERFKQAWRDYALTVYEDGPSSVAEKDAAWFELVESLERVRGHHASGLLAHDGHTGEGGSPIHLWYGTLILVAGGWGVGWLVSVIVRSQRRLLEAQANLEQRVEERTSEISRQNVRLSEEVAHRQALEEEILTIASEEQRRIAGWLHDDLGQRLTGLSLGFKALERELAGTRDVAGSGTVAELAQQVRAASEALRTLVRGLYPTGMTRRNSWRLSSRSRRRCTRSPVVSATCGWKICLIWLTRWPTCSSMASFVRR
jgi:signal transduction histidine kinase